MDKLDTLVTSQLIDRLLAPQRLREMLAGLLERREARCAEVDARVQALKTKATEADERLRGLYALVEYGQTEPDDLLKARVTLVAAVIERAREDGKTNEEFLSSLQNRIQSMANTQALLSQSRWLGVAVDDLLRAELEPYATSTNLQLQGPVVFLAPDATHAVFMVIHELTTNAVKYGALSRSGDQVSVRWLLKLDRPRAGKLEIQWTEVGGPQVAMQAVPGYGSSVIRDLNLMNWGNVDLGHAADGVRCTIELPGRSIVQAPADQSH